MSLPPLTHPHAPVGVKLIGWLWILSGVGGAVAIITLEALLSFSSSTGPLELAGMITLFLAGAFFVGLGLLRLKKSAWWLAITCHLFYLGAGLFDAVRHEFLGMGPEKISKGVVNLIIGVAILCYLLRPSIRALFGIRLFSGK